jgi:transcription initiation factor TFIIIB Brf1 subunit/transcription initiation factor TFIIB
MRAILIDWLVEVHWRFRLSDETLFLAVNIIDRYLSEYQVSRKYLQLIGMTGLFIASKFEDIYSPETKEFVYISDNTYNKEEILEMEGRMLSGLKFKLVIPSTLSFLNRYSQWFVKEDNKVYLSARYLIELSLIEYKMLSYAPSLIAVSALYLSSKLAKKEAWNKEIEEDSQYSEQDVRDCCDKLYLLLQNSSKASLQAVKRKYSVKFASSNKEK